MLAPYHETAPLPESVKTWTEEHPAGLYEPAPEFLPLIVVQIPEFVPVAALGLTSSSSPNELIAAAELEEIKLEPAREELKCPFHAHILKDSYLIAKTKAAGKQ
ncbi:hypothetical protein BDR04DRAFT_1120445 [Suillus decipiens]|nr:hypothetical protein BDR04DRAFT_1120445 [Suillus decipiens]